METEVQKKVIIPVGWTVIVKPDAPEPVKDTFIEGGRVVVPDSLKPTVDELQAQATTGVVMAVGDEAYRKFENPESNVPRAGDKVLFAKYAGQSIFLNKIEYRVLNDQDILGIVTEGNTDGEFGTFEYMGMPAEKRVPVFIAEENPNA